MPQTLAQAVRAKHPGAYDDLSDQALEQAVTAKFPGVYDDLPRTAAAPAPRERGMMDRVGDTLEGVAKNAEDVVFGGMGRTGVGRTLYNVAQTASRVLPASMELPKDPQWTQPRNTAERAGQAVENAAEFLAPGGLVKAGSARIATAAPKLATAGRAALEAVSAGTVAGAQGGNPLTAAATAGVGSGVVSKVTQAAPALKEGARKLVVEALGPTKERYKAMAARLAPEMLKRGIRGSREGMQSRAAEAAAVAGQQIDDALQQYGQKAVDPTPILAALDDAKQAFQTTTPQGAVVVFEPRAVRQLEGLQKIVGSLGPDPTVDQLVAIRRAWDSVVDQAGGFAHRSGGAIGIPLKEQTEAWAKREATGAIRKVLAQEVPDLAAVNKEFAFWKGLGEVLTQTAQRTQPHGPGLAATIATRTGQAVGGAGGLSSGAPGVVGGAVVGGEIAKRLQAAFTSPRWKMLNAQVKDAIADAILSGNPQRIMSQLARVGAYVGSRLPQPVPAQ